MTNELPLVITISRQFGSGGLFLGGRLAETMKMMLLDRQIIDKAAEKMGVQKENLEGRDERITPKWQSIMNSLAYVESTYCIPPEYLIPNDKEIFKVESEIILKVANENPVVIIGRGGGYILRNRPNHISIYLHADVEFRERLIQEQYSISAKEAANYVEAVDKSRTRYVHDITGRDMNDARQYHLSVDTGILGLEGAEKVIMAYLGARFGDINSINKCEER